MLYKGNKIIQTYIVCKLFNYVCCLNNGIYSLLIYYLDLYNDIDKNRTTLLTSLYILPNW